VRSCRCRTNFQITVIHHRRDSQATAGFHVLSMPSRASEGTLRWSQSSDRVTYSSAEENKSTIGPVTASSARLGAPEGAPHSHGLDPFWSVTRGIIFQVNNTPLSAAVTSLTWLRLSDMGRNTFVVWRRSKIERRSK
jgi:hypothetical protein